MGEKKTRLVKVSLNLDFWPYYFIKYYTITNSEKAGLKLNTQKMNIMTSGLIISWQIDGGNSGNSDRLYFGEAPKSLQMVIATKKLKDAYSLEEKL